MTSVLARNPKFTFELALNEPPYFGVRGQVGASLQFENAEKLLEGLIDRYLGNRESRLALLLLKRVADEVASKIKPARIYTWDYRSRTED